MPFVGLIQLFGQAYVGTIEPVSSLGPHACTFLIVDSDYRANPSVGLLEAGPSTARIEEVSSLGSNQVGVGTSRPRPFFISVFRAQAPTGIKPTTPLANPNRSMQTTLLCLMVLNRTPNLNIRTPGI